MSKVNKTNTKLHQLGHKTATQQTQNTDFIELKEVLSNFKNRLSIQRSLTPKSRKRLTTVGRERRLFTHQSLLTASEYQSLLPVGVSSENIQEWIETEALVLNIFTELEALKRTVYDFYYQLTHQEYQTALNIYRRCKMGSQEGIKDMPAIYEALKKAYMNGNRRKKDTSNPIVLVE